MKEFLDVVEGTWRILALVGIVNFLYMRFISKKQRDNQPLQSYLAFVIYSVLGVYYLAMVQYIAEPLRPWTAVIGSDNYFLNVVLILFVHEFILYATHWVGHNVEFLWCEHIVHHTSRDFSVHTVFRQAPGLMIWLLPTFINFFMVDRVTAFVCHGIMTFHAMWVHCDTKYELNFLSNFIHTPGTHRVHHELRGRMGAKNIGSIFTLFDHVFGTYEAPKQQSARANMKIGVDGYTGNEWVFSLFIMPYIKFFRKRLTK